MRITSLKTGTVHPGSASLFSRTTLQPSCQAAQGGLELRPSDLSEAILNVLELLFSADWRKNVAGHQLGGL